MYSSETLKFPISNLCRRLNDNEDYRIQIKNLKESLYETEKLRQSLCDIHNNHIR